MTRRRRAVCAPLLLLLVAGACTDAPVRPAPTGPVKGGRLRVAVRDLSSLDPARATGRGAMLVLGQVFRPLTSIGADGTAQPAAATAWRVSADGLQWDFSLGAGTFHDGTTVSASDFKFAFDRITQKATASDVAFQLEHVRGFHASKVAGTAKTLTGAIVVNAQRLIIQLERPFAELPRFLAHPALGPVHAATFNSRPSTFGAQPVGNGPFKVAEPRTLGGVTLARFSDFPGGEAWLDEVRVDVRAEADRVWRDLQRGDLDVGEVSSGNLADARRMTGTDAGFSPFHAATYYGLNLRLPKYANPLARKALSFAIDREALARDVYGGTKDPATGLVPAGIFDAGRSSPCDACTFSVARAKQLLAAVFKGKNPEFTIDHLDASPSREVARAVARMLENAGLRVTLRAHSSTEYLKLLQAGKHDIAELGWLSDVPSPDAFLAQQLRTGSPNNQTAFTDYRFDTTIGLARAAKDPAERATRYDQAERRALSLMPLIPLVFFRNHVGIRPSVHGLRLDGSGSFDASAVWLAPAK